MFDFGVTKQKKAAKPQVLFSIAVDANGDLRLFATEGGGSVPILWISAQNGDTRSVAVAPLGFKRDKLGQIAIN